jgi:APA family basic amino acid/polyamine antiporter
MVGAGVFTTSGYALQDLGAPHRVLAAWVLGGVIALAGAWSYGQLARAMPESGGEYLFLSRAAHPLIGFIAGWVSLIAGFTGATALAATAFESYVVPPHNRPSWLPQDVIAITIVVLGGIAHGVRTQGGAHIQNVAVVLKLGLLVGFLLFAAVQLPEIGLHGAPLAASTSNTWRAATAFATSLVWISLSYSGFNGAVYVAGEAHDARNTVPRAMMIGTSVVMLLYLLLNFVFVFGPPAERIAGTADVAAVSATWLGGAQLATAVRGLIALSLLTSVLGMVMSAPRVYAKMADDGLMPDFLKFRGSAPRVAIAAQVLLASVFILVSSLCDLLSYLGLTLSLCAALSVACLFLPSARGGMSRRKYWVSRLPAAFYVIATLVTASLMAISRPGQFLATLLTFSVGAVVYALVRAASLPGCNVRHARSRRFTRG